MIKCSSCNQVVSEGFCLNGGDSYFCSEKCRRTEITDKEWNNLYEDGGDSYWSTFNERHQVVTVEGIEVNTFNTFDEASEAIEKYERAFNARLAYEKNCIAKYDYPDWMSKPSKPPIKGERMEDFACRFGTTIQEMKDVEMQVERALQNGL